MKKQLHILENEIEELRTGLEDAKRKNAILEKELFKTARLHEYRMWQLNTFNNVILYQLCLDSKTKRKRFNPLVSIIIPVYNGANYLGDAINSALKQTYKNVEIIVVNDGSDDGGATKKVAEGFGNKIRYFEKENGGVSSALNYGINVMNGEYFSWLSHDDLIEPDHIGKMVRHISFIENKDDIPFSGFKIIDEKGNIKVDETIAVQLYCYDFKMSLLQNEMSLLQGEINGGSVLIPKKVFAECGGFDEKQPITQERDMWHRIMSRGYHFVNIPFATASIREHKKSVTQRNKTVIEQSNRKRLEIIEGIPDDVKKSMYGSVESYYAFQKRFLADNGLYDVVDMINANGKK